MSNQDLNWLSSQQPQQIGTDHGARARALLVLLKHTRSQSRARSFSLPGLLLKPYLSAAAVGGIAAVTAVLVLSAGAGVKSGAGVNSGASASVSSGARPGHLKPHTHAPLAGTHHSPLVRLADYVDASTAPSGDATLVARTTTTSNGSSVTVYDLYADNGQYFFSPNEGGLAGQVSTHNNLAGGLFASEVAAAKLAATGKVQAAAEDMATAADPGKPISPNQPVNTAADRAKEAATGETQTGSLYDNWVWENSQDALIAGSGQPDVRAGVLQILATLPGVTVTQGSSDGQPTLVLSAGAPELGSGYAEQLTINASSGVPIGFVGGAPGATPTAQVNYQVSRVTLANLPSGSAGGGGA